MTVDVMRLSMQFRRIGRRLALLMLAAPALAGPAGASRVPITPDELAAARYVWGYQNPGLSPDGRWLLYMTSKGEAITNLHTGQTFNAGRPDQDEYWYIGGARWSPSSKPSVAFSAYRQGKRSIVIWSPAADDDLDSVTYPVTLKGDNWVLGASAWSPDGKILYCVVGQGLPVERSFSEDDNPPWEGVNVRLRATGEYDEKKKRERLEKEYPDAYGENYNAFIVALEVASGRMTAVAKGTDAMALYPSPDGRYLLGIQPKTKMPDRETLWKNEVYSDVYLIELPKLADLPAIDFEKSANRKAGWLDHAGRPLKPILTDVQMNDSATYDPRLEVFGNNGNPMAVWAPDSASFAYATEGRQSDGDVYVYDLKARQARNLTQKVKLESSPKTLGYSEDSLYKYNSPKFGNWYPPLWMPDGKALLAVGRAEVWRIPVDAGQPARNLTRDMPVEVRRVLPNRQSTTDSNRVLLDASGRVTLLARERISRFDSVWKLDPATGATEKLIDIGAHMNMNAAADERGEYLVYSAQTPTSITNMYRLSLNKEAKVQPVTGYEPQIEQREFPQTRLLEIKTPEGLAGFALLYLPPAAAPGRPVPMVVSAYPGMRDSQLDLRALSGAKYIDEEIFGLLQQGIAVMKPDLPLSQEGTYARPMKQITDAVIAATDAAVATGLIDKSRLGITGGSYGGYMAQAVITQTDMFKAAASFAGIGDLFGGYARPPNTDWYPGYYTDGISIPWSEVGQGRMGAAPWDAPQNYVENSPVTYFNKVKTPILLIHGKQDTTVPFDESLKSFMALEHLKRKTIYGEYRRGFHGTNQEIQRRIDLWFREHLLGGKAVTQIADQGSFFLGGTRAQDKPSPAAETAQ